MQAKLTFLGLLGGISGLSSKAGFWYLELISFTVVSFSLVYLVGWLLTYLVVLSVCLFVCLLAD